MSKPDTAIIFKLRADIRHSRVGDEGVILRQDDAEVLVVNDVAARIVELIDSQRSLDDIIMMLEQEYEIDHATLEKDVIQYASELLESGIAETA